MHVFMSACACMCLGDRVLGPPHTPVKLMFNPMTIFKEFLYRADEHFKTGGCLMHIDPQRLEASSSDA